MCFIKYPLTGMIKLNAINFVLPANWHGALMYVLVLCIYFYDIFLISMKIKFEKFPINIFLIWMN